MIKERKGDLALRICDVCSHEQWVSYWNVYKKDKHTCRYCSCKHTAKVRKGIPWNRGTKQSPRFVGSYYINSGGYISTWIGKHTLNNKAGGYYLEHRLQEELKLGRSLKSKEIVHHIDGDKINNIPDNLYTCENDKSHQNLHSQLERVSMELVKMGLIKFDHSKGEYHIDPNSREIISKSLELLGSPVKDNQQRSFINMFDEERSTTIQKWSTLKRVEAGDNSKES